MPEVLRLLDARRTRPLAGVTNTDVESATEQKPDCLE
jgi:hypothetical protein